MIGKKLPSPPHPPDRGRKFRSENVLRELHAPGADGRAADHVRRLDDEAFVVSEARAITSRKHHQLSRL